MTNVLSYLSAGALLFIAAVVGFCGRYFLKHIGRVVDRYIEPPARVDELDRRVDHHEHRITTLEGALE